MPALKIKIRSQESGKAWTVKIPKLQHKKATRGSWLPVRTYIHKVLFIPIRKLPCTSLVYCVIGLHLP